MLRFVLVRSSSAREVVLVVGAAVFAALAACSDATAGGPAAAVTNDGDVDGGALDDAQSPPNDAAADAARDASPPPNGSKGCGLASALATPGPASGLAVDVTLGASTTKRTYALTVPTGYDPHRAYPLVFNFHSGGRTGAGARDYFGIEAFAGDKAVFVYPDGEKGNWELDTTAAQNKDVAFFDALVRELEAKLCIDTTRRFATGSSMGAYFVNQLGCRRGDTLRAIAPHAGGGPWETGGTYDAEGHLQCAQAPVAAMIFIGLADTNVDPSEGRKSIAHWSWANGCAATTKAYAPSPCAAFDGCKKPVVKCEIPNVGHRIWNDGPKATWDFFASF